MPEARCCAPCEQLWGRALGREHLDTLLRDAAVAAGAQLVQPAEVTAIACKDGEFVCELDDGRKLAARFVIAACGSWNTKGIFALPSPHPGPSDLFAFKAHFTQSRLPPGLMPLLAFPGGYGGMVQSDGARLSLSCCIRRDALIRVRQRHGGKAAAAVLAHIVDTTRGARLALENAELEGHYLSTGPIHPGIRARHEDGIFFTGNIAGEAHPVIAEGISMAIQSSRSSGRAVDCQSRRALCASLEAPLFAAHPYRCLGCPACHAHTRPGGEPRLAACSPRAAGLGRAHFRQNSYFNLSRSLRKLGAEVLGESQMPKKSLAKSSPAMLPVGVPLWLNITGLPGTYSATRRSPDFTGG